MVAQKATCQDTQLLTQHRPLRARNLTFSGQISYKFCYYHIRQFRYIRPYLDSTTTIATSIVHSKLDYCNSIYYNLHNMSLSNRVQKIQNSLASAVVNAAKYYHSYLTRCMPPLIELYRISTHLSHSLTKFSRSLNLHICTTSSLFSLLATLALHLLSLCLVHIHHSCYE